MPVVADVSLSNQQSPTDNGELGPVASVYTTDTTSLVLPDLLAGEKYTIQAHIGGATIPVPNSVPFTFSVPLATPQRLQCRWTSASCLHITFDGIKSATSYTITSHRDDGLSIHHLTKNPLFDLDVHARSPAITKVEVTACNDAGIKSVISASYNVENPLLDALSVNRREQRSPPRLWPSLSRSSHQPQHPISDESADNSSDNEDTSPLAGSLGQGYPSDESSDAGSDSWPESESESDDDGDDWSDCEAPLPRKKQVIKYSSRVALLPDPSMFFALFSETDVDRSQSYFYPHQGREDWRQT